MQKSPLPPQLQQKSMFPDSSLNFSSVPTPSCIQGMLGSSYPEGNATIHNCSKLGHPIVSEQNQQPWEPRFTMSQVSPLGSTIMLPSFPEKDTSVETENCANLHNQTLFGIGKDSPSLLSNAMPNLGISGTDNDISTEPYAASCFQNSLYGYLDGSSGLLQGTGEVDRATRTFVKVYKSGSVGRSLDITRFSSYEELRQVLGQMFGIEGLLNDPLRSGWQLVFVDRENDVLLLGDDPWESFVNNVWYIKILSPEDVLPVEPPGKVSQKVEDRVSGLQEIHATVRAKLEQTYAKYKAKADQQRRQQSFEVGDLVWVYLPRERYPQGAFTKLKPKKIGPCQVLEKFGDNAYRVELPDDVFISDVFNIRHLTPYAGENSSLRSSFSEEGESDEDIKSDQALNVPVPATQSQQATSGKSTPVSLRRSKRLQNKQA